MWDYICVMTYEDLTITELINLERYCSEKEEYLESQMKEKYADELIEQQKWADSVNVIYELEGDDKNYPIWDKNKYPDFEILMDLSGFWCNCLWFIEEEIERRFKAKNFAPMMSQYGLTTLSYIQNSDFAPMKGFKKFELPHAPSYAPPPVT